MKTNFITGRKSEIRNAVTLALLWSLIIACWSLPQARADLAAPDNVLYGLVFLDGQPVTAAQGDVVIEARRTNNLPVARYQMGTRQSAGDFYVLPISVEELAPVRNPVAVLTNEILRIAVVRNGIDQTQATFQVIERGQVQRMDFGNTSTNALSGIDAWAAAWGVGAGDQDPDHDGVSNYCEYVAGTCPTDSNNVFCVSVTASNHQVQISFLALAASGTGYAAGQQRYYVLETAPAFHTNAWTAVPGYSNILGAGQQVICTNPSPAFYRGKVELRSQ